MCALKSLQWCPTQTLRSLACQGLWFVDFQAKNTGSIMWPLPRHILLSIPGGDCLLLSCVHFDLMGPAHQVPPTWDSSGKNTELVATPLLQDFFPTYDWNPLFLHLLALAGRCLPLLPPRSLLTDCPSHLVRLKLGKSNNLKIPTDSSLWRCLSKQCK